MATDNEQVQTEKLREVARKHDKAAVDSYSRLGEAAWEMARHSTEIHDKGLFTYLGFETFDDWIAGRNMERSTCRMWLRRYSELSKNFNFSDIKKLSGQNAELLLRLPVKQRTEAMLRKAQDDKTPQFLKAVEKVLQRVAPPEEEAPELAVPFKVIMPTSKKEFVDRSMRDFAQKRGLEKESPSRILELLIAEAIASELNEPQILVAYLIPELRAMAELIKDKEHDPRWLLEQFGIRLERALVAVLKPETLVRGARVGG